MARSYNNWKQNLNEQEQKLQEIGQLVQPYTSNFNWKDDRGSIKTEFKDDKGNVIEVMFHKHDKNSQSFEAEFMVNKQSVQDFKTDLKHFFKIISTVIYATNDFLKKYKPYQLFIEPYEKEGKINQKGKIWIQYFKVNVEGNGYTLGSLGDKGFALQNNNNIKK